MLSTSLRPASRTDGEHNPHSDGTADTKFQSPAYADRHMGRSFRFHIGMRPFGNLS